jgi:hypothetical protein
MMHAQFTAGTVDISRFEARIIEGCQQLCAHVHHLASDQSEVRSGVVNLISTVKEIAVTVNTDHQASLAHQSTLGTTQENLSHMAHKVGEVDTFLGTTYKTLEDRLSGLEQACKVTAKSLAA